MPDMTDRARRTAEFRALHVPGQPLLLPNPWDIGSAKLFASLGFAALATTSSGYAMTLGRADGTVSREQVLAHAAALCAAVELPISADLENGYADSPEGVGETVRAAAEVGLAGASVEDWSGTEIYPTELAAERVRAAAQAARGAGIVLTARAENHLHGRPELADTITRLQAFQDAGADVLYAPGLRELADIRTVVRAVDRPVNVLAVAGVPDVSDLAEAGVARISVGGAIAFAALAAARKAALELRGRGTFGYTDAAAAGRAAAAEAFS